MSRRKSGIFNALTKLTRNEEHVEAQPSNTIALPNPLFLEYRPSKGNRRPGSLQDAFTSAVPVELPTEPHLILENKYPALRSLRMDTEIGDGLWVCCHCHHENILRHWKGPFLFKYLRCDVANVGYAPVAILPKFSHPGLAA
jgi:hypothetical protein